METNEVVGEVSLCKVCGERTDYGWERRHQENEGALYVPVRKREEGGGRPKACI